MAVLILRPVDCLTGGGSGAACRGPRQRGRTAFRRQKQEKEAEVQVLAATCAVPPLASKQARPPGRRGWANRRQRGRASPRSGAPRQPSGHVMENVVILKRGEQIAPEIRAASDADQRVASMELETAEPVPAEYQCYSPPEMKAEMVVVVEPCIAPAKKAVVVAAADQLGELAKVEPVDAVVATEQCGAPATMAKVVAEEVQCAAPATMAEPAAETVHCIAPAKKAEVVVEAGCQCVTLAKMDETVIAGEHCIAPAKNVEPVMGAEQSISPPANAELLVPAEQCIAPAENAEPMVDAEQCVAPAKKAVVVLAAGQRGSPATKAKTGPVLYSGPSFMISPDPSDLPIPGFLLKARRGRSAAFA